MRGGRATQLIPLAARPADLHPLEPTAERRLLLLLTLLAHAPAEIADAVGEARGGEGEGGGALARPLGRRAGCTTDPGIRACVTCLGCEVRPNRKNDHFCW
jgi:hypothetical protein